jgi:FAD/FMN-containing dehydrogenase/Fe-S oxidoreductase
VDRGTEELVAALRRAGLSGVDDSPLRRSLYASDASLYRVAPRVVVVPRHTDELVAALSVCRELSTPLTVRGAGTSIAGNAVGPGVVVDTSRHLHRILDVDAETRTALVEPGVVQSSLQSAAGRFGLRFGPDPSTHDRATLGGMVGNNACGSRSLGYGRTSDNVLGLDVLTGGGDRLRLGALARGDQSEAAVLGELRKLVAAELSVIRTELGRFGRQVSGYSLEHLLPERGFDVSRALVGSEGTLAVTIAARVRLVVEDRVRVLVVLGYPSMLDAADAVPAILRHGPVACEGLDARIVDVVRGRFGSSSIPPLPRGSGWLMVELVGDDPGEVGSAARRLVSDAAALEATVVDDAAAARALWRIREDGAGLSGRTAGGDPAYPGWEDAAVPPELLGVYLREFEQLMSSHRLTGVPYGHFGEGCLHIRIDFPLQARGGKAVFRDFLREAAILTARHGGTMSGEHGDGRARSELLAYMYTPAMIALFERVKAVFDPDAILNPGVIVRPAATDDDIRVVTAPAVRRRELPALGFSYAHDRGDLSMAVHRCSGIARCRVDSTSTQVMCPSFVATRDEKDSTRGRARVLQDAVAGQLGPDGWRTQALHDALDLCLSCKGCAADCPTGIDMAAYKAEWLHQRYRRRVRPRSHYALGWLPVWARLVERGPTPLARVADAAMRSPALHPFLAAAAGVDRRRPFPAFAGQSFRGWFASRPPRPRDGQGAVVLFVDTFTNYFSPAVGRAAVAVLEHAGYAVTVTSSPVCCGLTWISTGQLDVARRRVRATVRALLPHVRDGELVVGLEPSCTGVLRSDALELLEGADRDEAGEVQAATRTLAELLGGTATWSPPDLSATHVVVQPHCHHHAVMGWAADAALLEGASATVQRLGGCCGLAGNFGAEVGHYEVSVAVAEQQLLPAVRAAEPADVILADGFSCRTQVESLTDRTGEHLAQLLARHL